MALGNMLPRNFLGGMLAGDQINQQRQAAEMQQVMGIASLLQRQQEAHQRAQLAPLQAQLLQAQVGQAQGLADQRQREETFNQALPGLVQQATGEDGQLDFGRLSGLLAQTPGGLKPALDLRKAEEDRSARMATQEQNYLIRQQQLVDRRNEAMSRAQTQAERLAADQQYREALLGLRRESIETRKALASQGGRPPSGYQFNPDGTLAPIPGGPGDRTAQRNETAIQTLRKEFNALDQVKNFRTVVPIIQSIKSAKDTPAGDLDFIYAVGKILDPDSVVREGEMNMVVKSGSPLERFKGAINNVMGGGRLTPKIRENLMQMLTQRVGELKRGYDSAETVYRKNAERRNLPTDEIFMDFGTADLPAPPGGGSTGEWSIQRKQ